MSISATPQAVMRAAFAGVGFITGNVPPSDS